MADPSSSRFTVGVFQDVEWAGRGVDALCRLGFAAEAMSVIAKETTEVAGLVRRVFDRDAVALEVKGLGRAIAAGSLVQALQDGDTGLATRGLAATMSRAGFQPHDGFIFEALTARGGVLVAIESDPRAADALAALHAYGGGNAAIGVWEGRV